jgi:hypothetical protein
MVATKTQGSFNGSTLAGAQAGLAEMFAAAGYPTPLQNYTAGTPYELIYQFDNGTGTYANCFHRFSLSSANATTIAFNNISVLTSWNTTTRTGANGSTFPAWSTSGVYTTASISYTAYADNNNKYGLVLFVPNSSTNIILGFGFIKVESRISGFTENICPSTFLLSFVGGNIGAAITTAYTASTAQWTTIGSAVKFGNDANPVDPFAYNPITYTTRSHWTAGTKSIPSVQSTNSLGGYNVFNPLIISNAGAVIGTAPTDLVQGPLIGTNNPGDRLIVTQGVEEYEHLGAALWVRMV